MKRAEFIKSAGLIAIAPGVFAEEALVESGSVTVDPKNDKTTFYWPDIIWPKGDEPEFVTQEGEVQVLILTTTCVRGRLYGSYVSAATLVHERVDVEAAAEGLRSYVRVTDVLQDD